MAYHCDKCNYTTDALYNWNKHTKTKKHLGERRVISCLNCKQTFEYESVFKRHQVNCQKRVDAEEKKRNDKMAADMIRQLMEQNQELRDILLSQTDQLEAIVRSAEKQITDKIEEQMQLQLTAAAAKPLRRKPKVVKQITNGDNNTINNTNNNIYQNIMANKYNINVFLNVKCKDALNLTDFMDSIKIEVEDVEKLGEVGYADGISRIIIGALENLDLEKRPIHCKKKTVFVKDEDKWSEDEKRQQIMRLVRNVSQQNLRLFMSKCMGPERMDTESPDYDRQVALIRQVNGGKQRDVNERDVVKKIEEFAQLYEQALINCDFSKAELDDLENRMNASFQIEV